MLVVTSLALRRQFLFAVASKSVGDDTTWTVPMTITGMRVHLVYVCEVAEIYCFTVHHYLCDSAAQRQIHLKNRAFALGENRPQI